MGRDATPVLKGVKCIVDVRMSAGDADVDCSAAVSEKLVHLGAKVVKRLGRDTTHVVWLNGNRNVREDTLKRSEVKLVGPLWVEACLQTATRVPETKFFPSDTPANQSTPLPSPAAEKKKRRRSSLMEPRREDVFDELTTPIKKTRRQTLDAVTPMAITLTPQEVAKRCKMCGTSSTGVEPSQLLVGSFANKHDDISSRSKKPATRLTTKQPPPVEPNTPTPQVSVPRKKQPSTPIGTPKQGHHPPTPPRRGNTSSLKSIPVVKVATPVKVQDTMLDHAVIDIINQGQGESREAKCSENLQEGRSVH
ncbi:hypothetical protein DYB26_007030 [Aphanomyces astaci]|uniref:BRCT domain-containing protein n=1 Tax=Aphanomyces astaci TaxID=112090 RepID=A0A397DMQ6_APHAT|nr:hypothetical protein DYB38_003038 [Aphanomyces astaci]RHZ28415.1 hypothetical protein DYB26_007030 [Aphanomyces astaci]RHZ40758.1 hypothetical protein DYB31_003106 [Aphanomyces astaci]